MAFERKTRRWLILIAALVGLFAAVAAGCGGEDGITDGSTIEVQELRIDPAEAQAYIDGESADLSALEFKLLQTLAEEDRVVPKNEILRKVLGSQSGHTTRTVDTFVRQIRDKLDDLEPDHTFIQTRGPGYELEAEAK